jgi:ubiquinone/menaquinone biosynthesis C-methylase UbiE
MPVIDPRLIWNQTAAVEFFSRHRSRKEQLYESERQLLPALLAPGLRVLDVGCAAGGLLAVMQEYQPDIDYVGVDCSPLMVQEARRRFPAAWFDVSDATRLPFVEDSFDLVICTGGTLVTNLAWRDVLRECWRVTRDRFLFDLRVVTEGETIEDVMRSWVRLAFHGDQASAPIAPYVIVNVTTFREMLASFQPAPCQVGGVGYWHAVSDMASTPHQEVCMVQVALTKCPMPTGSGLQWKVPFPQEPSPSSQCHK